MKHRLICGDCLDVIETISEPITCIFADPPDNLGLIYRSYDDNLCEADYAEKIRHWLYAFIHKSAITWISFNAKWWRYMAQATQYVSQILAGIIELKPCVQTYTFYQHNQRDLGNAHRPLWRFRWKEASLYPGNIRVPSQRQLNGDKRADPRGKVPGDVFDFPRVVGNSKQRRVWIPTQLHEGLVERCILLSTKPGDLVLDPFAGSGTVLRMCKRLDRRSISIEIDPFYCKMIAAENDVQIETA